VPKSPRSFDPIPEEFDSADSLSIDGDVGDSERFLKHALALSETGYATPKPISEQLLIQLGQGRDPAEAVGNLHLSTEEIPHWSFGSISNVLSDYEAARLYVYRELTDRPDYRIDEDC